MTVPLLRSEYGKDYDFEAPVKLLDRMMHSLPTSREQQVPPLAAVRPAWWGRPARASPSLLPHGLASQAAWHMTTPAAAACRCQIASDAQVVVLGQVLAADCTVGYEEIVNTQVRQLRPALLLGPGNALACLHSLLAWQSLPRRPHCAAQHPAARPGAPAASGRRCCAAMGRPS